MTTKPGATVTAELKACPFCGESAQSDCGSSVYGRMWWSVGCTKCDVVMHDREVWEKGTARLDNNYPEKECFLRWNTRTPSPADQAAVVNAMKPILDYMEKLVEGWQRDPKSERHPPRIGVTLKTDCGTIYKIVDALRTQRPAASGEGAWKCGADRSGVGGNHPSDCNWPVCGCDPHANKVIEALEESGYLTPAPATAGGEG